MNFIKKNEKIIRLENDSYFSVKHYFFRGEGICKRRVVEDFMKSKFFVWQEKYRDEVIVNENNKKIVVDWNFHGLYDVNKLSVDDFEQVNFQEFKSRFLSFIANKTGSNKKLLEDKLSFSQICNSECGFYVIKDLPEDKVHNWTVYDFFISGIALNFTNNTIILVEFGRD